MMQTAQAPTTVPYEVYQRERELRIKAERERDTWKNEFYLLRKLRRAPVLKPATKEVIEEFRHVEKWGQVDGPNGTKRANYKTIAKNLHMDAGTVARHAERAEKLGIVDILEYQGSKDESERKYVHVKEDKLATIDKLVDPEKVIPQQGGDRFTHRCMKCDGEMEIRTITKKRTKIMLRCTACHHESILEEDLEDIVEDTGWKMQNGQKAQKQHAFGETPGFSEAQKQNAHHSVYTLADSEDDVASPNDENSQKQVAFNASASYARTDDMPIEPPAFLRRKAIWCCWRWGRMDEQGKRAKVPFIANNLGKQKASVSDPNTWRAHAFAVAVYERFQTAQGTFVAHEQQGDVEYAYRFDGIGFMCDGTFTFYDDDHCRNPETGEIAPASLERARRINSYTEPSVSGHGIHSYAEGTIEANRKHNGVEMYFENRFCVYTGCPLPDFPQEVEPRQDELRALHRSYFPAKPEFLWNIEPDDTSESKSDDEMEQLLADVKARMARAKNAEKCMKLWAGDCSDYANDHSRADAAFCKMLAHYVGKSVSIVDWLFRKSKLMRPKWERADYRERTFRCAFSGEQIAS
jgi:hypothetical protein